MTNMKYVNKITYEHTLRTIQWIAIGCVLPLQFAIAAPPTVAIDTPAAPVTIIKGQALNLTGHASDISSGSLTGDQLVWTSDRDGPLGKGASVNSHLSAGVHTVTLNATNTHGESALATVTVTVGY